MKPGYKLTEVGVIPEAGGFTAISRWLSAATPPVCRRKPFRILEGCQPGLKNRRIAPALSPLRSLQDREFHSSMVRGYRCAQPPANGWNPSRMRAFLFTPPHSATL